MWLVFRNSIITKDNLRRRNWQGNPLSCFCDQVETSQHLYFGCNVAKAVRGTVANCLRTNNRPQIIQQFYIWTNKLWPQGKEMFTIGLSAVCWAIWKCRNKACFELKNIHSPMEMVYLVSSFCGIGQVFKKEKHRMPCGKVQIIWSKRRWERLGPRRGHCLCQLQLGYRIMKLKAMAQTEDRCSLKEVVVHLLLCCRMVGGLDIILEWLNW